MFLSELRTNESGFIIENLNKEKAHNIEEFGFIKGEKVTLVSKSPLKDYLIFCVLNYNVALKKEDADLIVISKTEFCANKFCSDCLFCKTQYLQKNESKNNKNIKVAIIGNSNCGKTSFFNFFNKTKISSKINEGYIENFKGCKITIFDLPGIFSLKTYNSDENISILNTVDVIINVIDSNIIERSLFLTTELLSLNKPIVIALNMFDEFEKEGSKINIDKMSMLLHNDVVKTSFKFNRGTEEVLESVIKEEKPIFSINDNVSLDFRHNFIKDLLQKCDYKKGNHSKRCKWTHIIDKIVTNKYCCYLIFIFIMLFIFKITFDTGEYFMSFVNPIVNKLSYYISSIFHLNHTLQSLIVDGLLPGICIVLSFLPQMVVLFFSISLIEESGYMSRIIFFMDKLMAKIGLHGKSCISIITGFGCNVPAILATRIIENKKARLITILMIPLISCSARLPIYTYIISKAFYEKYKLIILFGIYSLSIISMVFTSIIFAFFIKRDKEDVPLIDLRPYRLPPLFTLLKNSFFQGFDFLKKIVTTITLTSCIIWSLSYFPHNDKSPFKEQIQNSYIAKIGKSLEPVFRIQNFDWKMNSALIAGISCKESVVSTLTILNKKDYKIDPKIAIPFLVFVSLYFPCFSTIATIRKELSFAWALFSAFYVTVFAWIISVISVWIVNLF